jgi:heptosyltransferase-2
MRKRSAGEIRQLIKTGLAPAHIPATAHHVHDYLLMASLLGASPEPLAPRIFMAEEEAAKLSGRLGMETGAKRPWFGLNPTAQYGPAKRWPAAHFVAAAITLQKRTHCGNSTSRS